MLEAFRLAYDNLQDIWRLVLPPKSLLGLKRLSVANAAAFHLPERLWARHCLRLSPRLPAAHHQPRASARRAHSALPRMGRQPHQHHCLRHQPPRAISKRSPPLSRPTSPTWSHAGAGQTGSTHECPHQPAAAFKSSRSRFRYAANASNQGVSPMQTVLATVPPAGSAAALAVFLRNNATIWVTCPTRSISRSTASFAAHRHPARHPGLLYCRGCMYPDRPGSLRAAAAWTYHGQV